MVPIGARFAYDDEHSFVYFSFVFVPKSIHACAFSMSKHIQHLERTETSRSQAEARRVELG